MKVREIVDGDNENYAWRHAKIDVSAERERRQDARAGAPRL